METKIFDIKLPTSWAELSDKQLLLIFDLFARDLSAAEVKTLCPMNNIVGGYQRVAKKWFSRKYYASVMNIRDFMAESVGEEFVGIVAQSLDDNHRRYNH